MLTPVRETTLCTDNRRHTTGNHHLMSPTVRIAFKILPGDCCNP
uniref:Uncharacterized protein n=1 Tax=Siphoviridae sp. ctkV91 TaxID=2827924 RepID=A0A8S5TEX1_9CAUD|nr:MAG TPA: hypothetical protein [Siphoviridae sp. ctkV91]DAX64011.1 MAG TPA: hypothetical protein [Caudoviricetes sp.]